MDLKGMLNQKTFNLLQNTVSCHILTKYINRDNRSIVGQGGPTGEKGHRLEWASL